MLAEGVVSGNLLNVAFLKQAIKLHIDTMARITLIRHGKTEIPTPAKHDFDRSLNLAWTAEFICCWGIFEGTQNAATTCSRVICG